MSVRMHRMHLRILVSVTVFFGLNLSLCTGGVLASFAVFSAEVHAASVVFDESAISVPMTSALAQFISCVPEEPKEEAAEEE